MQVYFIWILLRMPGIMQVVKQKFWTNRSLSYLCSIFQNLESGDDYAQIKLDYHIGILDFSPFPDYPEFYASYKVDKW